MDSLVGVVPVPPFIWSTEDGRAVPHWDYEHRLRRQDMTERELRYRETGSLYVTRTSIYETSGNRLGGRIGAFVMEPVEGTDIDSWDDLELAAARIRAASR